MRAGIAFVLFVVLGGLLMFGGRAFALMGVVNRMQLPYWWSYVILYPLAGIQAVRGGSLRPLPASVAVCLLPALYFTAIGVLDSNWHASGTAILGVGIAFAITLVCAFLVGLRQTPRAI